MSLVSALLLASLTTPASDLSGTWRGSLTCPGGEIPFGLEFLMDEEGDLDAVLVNGPERMHVERVVEVQPVGIVPMFQVHIDPYDSRLEFSVVNDHLSGEWIRYRTAKTETRLPFTASKGPAPRFELGEVIREKVAGIEGRWRVEFSSSEDHAVGLFDVQEDGRVAATFLTTLGDYRFLEGVTDGDSLSLSVFDGAHAFLFAATAGRRTASLRGDFWSRDSWHESWTAVKRPWRPTLPDPYQADQRGAPAVPPWRSSSFADVDGETRVSVAEPAFGARATIGCMVIFGTWCPNCYDQTKYLVELHRRYAGKGLSILGLAFEFGDDLARQTEVVKRYADYHEVPYPILIAGTNDKQKATKAFPLLDRVRSYPTVVFLDAEGEVLAINTGFSGPATGKAHQKLRERFEAIIESGLR